MFRLFPSIEHAEEHTSLITYTGKEMCQDKLGKDIRLFGHAFQELPHARTSHTPQDTQV